MGGLMIVFFSVLAVLFAGLVIALRQPMRSALALVAHMVCLSAIYACLGVHVVAVFQLLIYVGAVMVFMVYTIMLLDDRDDSFRQRFSGSFLPALAILPLLVGGVWQLTERPAGATLPVAAAGGSLFTFASFAGEFMKRYWFHFELATVLLLVGLIAAWTAVREGNHG
ncbi:MAG TPA: NADH-quinone oxidoreductase subunit J [Geomonas sp.]|nr:NADH-quinone oxidoreductase subunit J [Geomonas sp.]